MLDVEEENEWSTNVQLLHLQVQEEQSSISFAAKAAP
jgi:hypothetical protein